MATTVRQRLDDVHPQMLRLGVRPEAKVDPQQMGEALKREIGAALERALGCASITKKEAAFAMGYTDSAVIGRWTSGVETPQIARLWTLGERFQTEFIVALAELAGQRVEIETVVRVRRTA